MHVRCTLSIQTGPNLDASASSSEIEQQPLQFQLPEVVNEMDNGHTRTSVLSFPHCVMDSAYRRSLEEQFIMYSTSAIGSVKLLLPDRQLSFRDDENEPDGNAIMFIYHNCVVAVGSEKPSKRTVHLETVLLAHAATDFHREYDSTIIESTSSETQQREVNGSLPS